MGCDGGTIPRRDELVRLKKKPEQKDKHMERMAKWLHCAITQEPLREPIVACELGRLYNKESILEYLLDKSTSDSADHIRSLKDVRVLTLTENPAYGKRKVDKGDAYVDTHEAPFICPVTGIEMNGLYKFCYLWTCGCAMSEKALKEVKSAVCHKCGVPYNSDEIILNGSDEDVEQLRTKMDERRARAKAEKKSKKAQKRKLEEPSTSSTATNGETSSQNDKNGLTNGKTTGSKSTNGSASSSSSSTSSKTLANGSTSTSGKPTNGKAANGYTNKEFDPKKSKVYKSLFLSKEDKDKQGAHWVTYNPYYAMSK
ncbi:replication termination factor 2-like [Amphiura filiformis]|uniref:replication termination factor 2-like n=1 Tax=Amphiura filiformis TaxID=82378 RepID=UPI003B21C424